MRCCSNRALTGIRNRALLGVLGRCGWSSGDVEARRAALAQLLDDGDLRRQLGEGGTPPLRDLRASSVIQRFERAYADLFGRYHETIRPA